MDPDDDIKLYTTKQVADLCEVTVETVRNWIDAQDLPALKINNAWRIRKSDLRDFLNKRYHTGEERAQEGPDTAGMDGLGDDGTRQAS